jgi:uncharacterized protein YggE
MSRAISLVFWAMAAIVPTLAQTDSIAVSALKTVELTPDEITFNLGIGTDPEVSLDQVLAAMQTLSLAATDLVGIGSQQLGPSVSQTRIIYQFAFTIPFAKFKETNDKITTVRRSLAGAVPAMDVLSLSIVINPTDAARDQAFQTALPDLIADARRRADRLAKAAGLTVGGITGLNEILAPTTGISSSFGPISLRTTVGVSVRFAVK